MPFLPKESNACEKQNAWCSALVPAQDMREAPPGLSVLWLFAMAPMSTGRQEEGSGTGTSSKANFMVCKVRGEQGIREKESNADKTKQP